MSKEQERKETYQRIKKRISEYRYRSIFFRLGVMGFTGLTIFSVFPLVPVIIIVSLGLSIETWSVPLWFLCSGVFLALLIVFLKLSQRTERKRAITLEEYMYVPAYEALCHLKEFFDSEHPISSGKRKAESRIRDIEMVLNANPLPNSTLIRDDALQLIYLKDNLRNRLLPSIKEYLQKNEPEIIKNIFSAVTALVDYARKPQTSELKILNESIATLPEGGQRSFFSDLSESNRSILQHTIFISLTSVLSIGLFYVDTNSWGATMHEALAISLPLFVAIIGVYVTYLGLTKRKEQKG